MAFPPDFLWGVATSAYQIEGAVRQDGRGVSIWDTFSHTPGKTHGGDNGDVACDHYHRYREDVALMARMGVGAYRFSVAWPRIQPDGSGPPNRQGLDFYSRLVDELLTHDIVPVATLYHWDLPQPLEDAGGWPERETTERFAEYAAIVAGALADRVDMWITLNEPWVAAWLGYGDGVHAPGIRDVEKALAASHHLLVAHGLALQAVRATGAREAGITLDLVPVRPASGSADDARASELVDLHRNRLFLDPLFGRGYPHRLLERYASALDLSPMWASDLEVISAPIDFLGVNYYRRELISGHPPSGGPAQEAPGDLGAWSIPAPGVPTTEMGWAIEPEGLTELLLDLNRRYSAPSFYVTENGAAFDDSMDAEGRVVDRARIDYLEDHLAAAARAMEEGVPLRGYFVWSLLDNFEWAEGYSKRFGLVFVDYADQSRIPKESFQWYEQLIRRSGLV